MSDVLRESLRGFGTSIFSTITEQAIAAGAINLAQGFPDFEPPERLVEAAAEAVRGGLHQYAPSTGDPVLRQAVAEHQQARYGLPVDPDTEVTVTAGASEAITAALLALLEPGDEVVLVEPYYDLYPYAVVAAGGVPRYLTTSFPDFRLDLDRLRELVTDRTRVIVVNTPTNPTGRLLGPEETRVLGELAERHDAYLLSDEVYEHIVFDGLAHRPVAADEACRDRTITVSSVSKTFSATGWRIGWAVAPPALSAAVRSMHQFITFTAPTPLQRAAGVMLGVGGRQRLLRAAGRRLHRAPRPAAEGPARDGAGGQHAPGDVFRDDPVRGRRRRVRAGPDRRPAGGRDPGIGLLQRAGAGPRAGPLRLLQAAGDAAGGRGAAVARAGEPARSAGRYGVDGPDPPPSARHFEE